MFLLGLLEVLVLFIDDLHSSLEILDMHLALSSETTVHVVHLTLETDTSSHGGEKLVVDTLDVVSVFGKSVADGVGEVDGSGDAEGMAEVEGVLRGGGGVVRELLLKADVFGTKKITLGGKSFEFPFEIVGLTVGFFTDDTDAGKDRTTRALYETTETSRCGWTTLQLLRKVANSNWGRGVQLPTRHTAIGIGLGTIADYRRLLLNGAA